MGQELLTLSGTPDFTPYGEFMILLTVVVGPVGPFGTLSPSDCYPAGPASPYVAGGPVGPDGKLSPFTSDHAGPAGRHVAVSPVGPSGVLSPYTSGSAILHKFDTAVSHTVQITFIFIGQTHLVFGKCVCTCVTKHSNAFRTFLNWLKNSKRVWHQPKLHILRLPIFANFDL